MAFPPTFPALTVRDNKEIIPRERDHLVERKHLCIGPLGRAGNHNAAVYVRVSQAQLFRECDRGIIRAARANNNFELGIVLLKEAFEILLEAFLHAMHRFKDRYGGKLARDIFNRALEFAGPPLESRRSNQRKNQKNGRADQPECRDGKQHTPNQRDHGPSSRLVKTDLPPLRARK